MCNINRVIEEQDKENKVSQKRILEELKENKRRNEEYQKKMNNKIANLEEALNRSTFRRMKQGEIQQLEPQIQPAGIIGV